MRDETRRAEARAGAAARNAAGGEIPGRLVPLDDLPDFKVAEGDPDVRGWDVASADDKKIGEVHDLIVDVAAMKVRYLDIDVDNDVLGTEDDRHILVPVGCATMNEDDDEINLTNVNASDLKSIPGFQHGAITRDFESSLRGCYPPMPAQATGGAGATRAGTVPVGGAPGRTATTPPNTAAAAASGPAATAGARVAGSSTGENFYGHEHFDENRFFGNRRQGRANEQYIIRSEEELNVGKRKVRAGEVDVRKRVETEHVEREVPVMHEEVTVERRPAPPGASAQAEIGENEIRIPIMEEEAVVEKRVVPKEEVVVQKHAVQGEQKVEADVRKERADVEREGKRK